MSSWRGWLTHEFPIVLWRELLQWGLPRTDWGREKEIEGKGQVELWTVGQTGEPCEIKGSISTLDLKTSYLGCLLRNPLGMAFVPCRPSSTHREQTSSSPWLSVCVSTGKPFMTPLDSHVKSQLLAPFPACPRAAPAVTLHLPATQNSFLPQTCQSVLCLVPCTCCSLFLEFISSPFSQYFQIIREPEVLPPWWSPSWSSREGTHSPTPTPTCPLPSQALRPDFCLYHRLLKTSIYSLPPALWELRFIFVS